MIDGGKLSDEFEGIGALKQGGQQRGIYDYPEPQREEIMDFLFSEIDAADGAGAAFQSLKVEIGGDGYAGEAAEPSFAHTRAELDGPYRYRGDTWWWMQQARLRNPSIPLMAIPWGVPGWVGGTTPESSWHEKFFSADNIDYLVRFLRQARDASNELGGPSLAVQYLGIWNETNFYGHEDWLYALKRRLSQEALDVKLVGADLGVNPDPDPLPALYAARAECGRADNLCNVFDVVGVHYPGAGGSSWTSDARPRPVLQTRPPTEAEIDFARAHDKPLWSSEDAASGILAFGEEATTRLLGEWYGALKLAHLLNTNYIYGRYVHTDVLFFANGMMSDMLYAPGAGLLSANRPWDGHFDIQPGLWAVAHTTQFAQPGWRYVESACGGLTQDAMECTHDATSEGSYVTLSDGVEFSVVVETKGAPEPITREFVIYGLPHRDVHVWVSTERGQLCLLRTIDASAGRFTVTFDPDAIYTLTTTTGQRRRAQETSLPQRRFPDPYEDDFASYGSSPASRTLPRYITAQEGSFELARTAPGGATSLEQNALQPANEWPVPWIAIHPGQRFGPPHALFGDDNWTDYEVTGDARFAVSDGVSFMSLLGRLQAGASEGGDFQRRRCYELRVAESGEVALVKHRFVDNVLEEQVVAGPVQLDSGLGLELFSLRLRLDGYAITGYVGGSAQPVVRFLDESQDPGDPPFLHGPAGIGTGWHAATFDRVGAASIASAAVPVGDADLHYVGAWRRRSSPPDWLASRNTVTSSNTKGDTASMKFRGRGVIVCALKAQNGGRARIAVDGRYTAVVDFYREARAIGGQVVYSSPHLDDGQHVLTIQVLGSGQPGQLDIGGAGTNFVHLDGVVVIP